MENVTHTWQTFLVPITWTSVMTIVIVGVFAVFGAVRTIVVRITLDRKLHQQAGIEKINYTKDANRLSGNGGLYKDWS